MAGNGIFSWNIDCYIINLRHRKAKWIMSGVDLIFRVAAIGIIVAVLNMLLVRAGRDDQAMMTTIAGLIVVLLVVIQEISNLFDTIKNLFGL